MENALKHGISHLVEGGVVVVTGSLDNGHLRLAVENPCDPLRPSKGQKGIGLANVRGRLQLLYRSSARLAIEESPESFRVEMLLPESGPSRQERI